MKRRFSISFPGVTSFFSGIADVSGRPGKSVEVGRLGLEPRTKALKGFYRRPMLSSRISQVSDLPEFCLSMSSVVSCSFSVLFPYGLS